MKGQRQLQTRPATEQDVVGIAQMVNHAYAVEAFFVEGDRTSPAAVREDLARGTVLVVTGTDDEVQACVFVSVSEGRGYFGMLAVAPALQGHGLGRALIDEAERLARSRGAVAMDISVVNVRTDLLDYYGRLGYVRTGTEPYVHRPVIQPVNFITMAKPL